MDTLFDDLPTEEGLILAKIIEGGKAYKPDFYAWMKANTHIWKRFVIEADKVRGTGRPHYSARTIGEFLRHQTSLREAGSVFKVNDHVWPDCARLYVAMRPESVGFFEFRNGKGRS